jgi:hypothetical protein
MLHLNFFKSIAVYAGQKISSFVNKAVCAFCVAVNLLIGNPTVQKYVAAFWLGFYTVSDVMASSKGAGGFTKATTEIQSYETPVSNLMKAIAAVIVLVGAFNVYFKMQNGDQDVKKTVMMTIGGCVAFIAMSEALPMFFK